MPRLMASCDCIEVGEARCENGWPAGRRASGAGGVGVSGDRGDALSPVSEDGGVMDAIEASIEAALFGGVVGIVGVTLPFPLEPSRPFDVDDVGLPMPLAGGLMRFSFCRLCQ